MLLETYEYFYVSLSGQPARLKMFCISVKSWNIIRPLCSLHYFSQFHIFLRWLFDVILKETFALFALFLWKHFMRFSETFPNEFKKRSDLHMTAYNSLKFFFSLFCENQQEFSAAQRNWC